MRGSGCDAVDVCGRGIWDAVRLEVLFRLDARVSYGYAISSVN